MNQSFQDRALLKSLLRGELAAAGCYAWTRKHVKEGALVDLPTRALLAELQAEHEKRAEQIRRFLEANGETSLESAGPWGALTRVFVRLACLSTDANAGMTRVLALLREGEDYGLAQYQSMLPDLSFSARYFVADELLRPQAVSLGRMTELAKQRLRNRADEAAQRPSVEPSRQSIEESSTMTAA